MYPVTSPSVSVLQKTYYAVYFWEGTLLRELKAINYSTLTTHSLCLYGNQYCNINLMTEYIVCSNFNILSGQITFAHATITAIKH